MKQKAAINSRENSTTERPLNAGTEAKLHYIDSYFSLYLPIKILFRKTRAISARSFLQGEGFLEIPGDLSWSWTFDSHATVLPS